MRKSLFKLPAILIITLLILTTAFTGCKKAKDNSLVTVRLNEVVRSVFYAPMYAAISQGFFKEEGIEIDLSTGQGADATVTNTQVKSL